MIFFLIFAPNIDCGYTLEPPGLESFHSLQLKIFILHGHVFVMISFFSYQMLYADTYMTLEEFREMFDHTLYDKMRKQLDCEKAFPEVYGKVNRKVRD